MADTLNDSLVKVTEELKEANERSLQASKELGKVTAASKASYSSIGEAVKEAVGIDKLKDAFMNLPGMNVAKAVKDVVFKKRQEKREQTNLAKRLGITRDQLLIQKAEQEVLLARESEGQKLIEAAEKLGFNTDRIAKVNEEGNVELNGSLRESNGQFVSKSDASADANLRALKDFSSTEEQSQEKPEPKTKREDFTPVEETSLDKNTLEKLATENTLLAIADNILDAMKPTTDMNPMGPSGASLSEDAGEDRRAAKASLAVAEETNRLLREDDGDKKDSDKEGGLFNGILAPFKSFKAGLLAIPAIFSSIVAGITTFAGILAPLALPIVAVVAGITAAIGFITGFMEGFAVGGIFGGLKEGLMKLFDWFIGLPLKILKDITVWVLGALGMDGLADALDAFPLVESVRKIFSFLTDLIVVPLGFVMDTIGGLFGGLFDIVMAPIRALSTAIMSVFDGFSDIFSGIKMIFQGDILGGFNSMFSGIKTLIMAPINFVIDTVKGIFGGIFDMIMAPFNALFGAIGFIFGPQSALGGVVEWFSETLGSIWETITAPFDNVMAFLSDLFSFPTSFGDGLMKLIDIIYYPINLAVNFVKDLFGFGDPDKPFKLSEFLLDTVKGIWDWFTGLFSFDGSALMDGIANIGTIMKALGKAGFAAVKAILPGGESPGEAFSRVYNEVSSGGEASMPDDTTINVPETSTNSFEGIQSTITAVGTSIASKVNSINIPVFSETHAAVQGMAVGLGNKVSSMWGSVTSLFATADKKQAEIDEANAFQEARSTGLYNENYFGNSKVDESKIADASDMQLKAILADKDMSEDQTKLVQDELAKRQESAVVVTAEPQMTNVESAQAKLDTALAAQAKGIYDFADISDQTALDGEVALAQMDLDEAKRASATVEAPTVNTPIVDSAASIAETVTAPTAPAESSSGIAVFVSGQEGKFTKEMIEEGIKDGSINRKWGMSAIKRIARKEKAAKLESVGASSGSFQSGQLVETTPSTGLNMGSESISNSVTSSALNASTTASNLTYVPSKMAPLPTGSVSTTQLGSGAVMQAEVVQLHAQRTMAIQEQSQVNRENAAMAPVAMMNSNSQQIVNNVTNQSSKTMMIPVPVSDPNVESWNPMNGR